MADGSVQVDGFIVDAFHQTVKDLTRLNFAGRLSDGKTFAIVEAREHPGFYLRCSDRENAEKHIIATSPHFEQSEKKTIDGEPCVRVDLDTVRRLNQALETLTHHGIRTYEADIRFEDQFRISKQIHGSVTIKGSFQSGRYVDYVFVNPELTPSSWEPQLSVLSFDIETSAPLEDAESIYEGSIIAIGISYVNPIQDISIDEVFFLGPELEDKSIRSFDDEATLLKAFTQRILDLDPDIITGWNVIDFDFRVLAARLQHCSLAFIHGRTGEPGAFLRGSGDRSDTVVLRGRQIIDGARLVRAAPQRYEDYSLETVAQTVLGYGKLLEEGAEKNKLEFLYRLYREVPDRFCRYCQQDARLVLEILQTTGLLTLTLKRCQLIGIDISRAWTSIASFEFLYIEAMHKRNIVAPTIGIDPLPLERAPGGAILEPHPGVFDNVLVYDFKSLYPSIIRTFNIDPIGYVAPNGRSPTRSASQTSEHSQHHPLSTPAEHFIVAPNGASFRRSTAILPELLDRFFENRAKSQAQSDEIASFVYKILMNSFYGVLGASGCRFASSEIAGAITSFGQSILQWCKDLIQKAGYQVLYGDTDSLFVASTLPPETDTAEVYTQGENLCVNINERLAEHISETYSVESRLTLELEKIYARFFLPPVRAGNDQTAVRGRAKGYAGFRKPIQNTPEESAPTIEVIGMEAVRRDWTELAKECQLKMLELLFNYSPIVVVREYIHDLLKALRSGKLDEKLVYRKALRKPVAAYTRTSPPHVRAAALLDPSKQHGVIRYIWTVVGPQPEEKVDAQIDYEHYVEKQLKPICRAFIQVLDVTIEELFSEDSQLWLF